jgi:alpha-tubulin suppressor-like RCC1 family protein
MLFYKSQGIRYIIVKAATSDELFNGSYDFPQFTRDLVNTAHAHGILIFGYNRSYGENVPGEIAVSDFVFNQGADGFVWDAEGEWESSRPWIGTNGPALAWQLCSAVRSNWPTKFLAHAPFPIISYHSSFPYKEFGYWSDAVMPQIYPYNWTGVKSRPSGAINWTDVNWYNWQNSLAGQSSVINGQTIYWTNSIKPLAPVNHVYGPNPPNSGVSEIQPEFVMEFVDYLNADPTPQTVGGYKGANFWRADLHGAAQWTNIQASTIGSFAGIVNNIVIDDPTATNVGPWASTRTFYNGNFYGNGSETDFNSFGTNYLTCSQGSGAAYVQFTPNILVAGDYEVYQWHPSLANASASVPHLINHDGGSTTVYANQQTNAGKWSLLGRFGFAAGTAGNIQVLDSVAEPTAVAIADGVKLVYIGSSGPPTIINQPQGTSILSGQSASFSVTATGSAPLSYQWRFNDVDMPGATSSALTIASTGVTNAGAYSVCITNGYGATCSSNAVLGVIVATTAGDNTFQQTDVPALATNVVAISAGAWHSLALCPDGTVLAWGDSSEGQCAVPDTLTDAIAVAAGAYHNLAIKANGTIVAWGADDYGQTDVPAGLSGVVGIAAGTWHSVALRSDGTVAVWGDNTFGQTNYPAGLTNVTAVAAGGNHSLALKADGTVVAWGDNADAEGYAAGQSVVPWGLTDVVAIAAGEYHSLALKADGTVVAWGDNSQNQCIIPEGLTNVVAVAGGGAHSLALRADGVVIAWGANWNGQCDIPLGLVAAVGIAAGSYHTVVLLEGVTPVPRLMNPVRNGDGFSVLLQTLNRRSYTLEYKDSLAETNWTILSTNAGNGALKTLADPSAVAPQRFYRSRQW